MERERKCEWEGWGAGVGSHIQAVPIRVGLVLGLGSVCVCGAALRPDLI